VTLDGITYVAMNRAGSENPLGLGLVIVGAAVMAIATFLPFDEPTGVFATIRQNTLIQIGQWWLIGLALGIAGSGYRVYQRNRAEWVWSIILCAVAAIAVLVIAGDKSLRTLYPVRPDGTLDTSQPGTVATLGIAIYVAGAGVAVALIGSVMLRHSARDGVADEFVESYLADRATKKCPDCAETVLADAKVCKHCGYRLVRAADGNAESKPISSEPQPPARPHRTPEVEPRTSPPTSSNALRLGDRVKVVAPGDKNDGKIGKVTQVLDGGNVGVCFGGVGQFLWEYGGFGQSLWEYPFRPNQLTRLDSPTK
jgi:hypothetical protein